MVVVVDVVVKVGLLLLVIYEWVCNIVVLLLFGWVGGLVDVWVWVGEFDVVICVEFWLVELGGWFWFGFDDGCVDVFGLGVDVGV